MNIYYYDRITMAFDDLLKCKRYFPDFRKSTTNTHNKL